MEDAYNEGGGESAKLPDPRNEQIAQLQSLVSQLSKEKEELLELSHQGANQFHELEDRHNEALATVAELRKDGERLQGLIDLTEPEGENGKFAVTLEYDNYQDVALVKDAAGKIIGEALAGGTGDPDEDPELETNRQFRTAIDKAMEGTK